MSRDVGLDRAAGRSGSAGDLAWVEKNVDAGLAFHARSVLLDEQAPSDLRSRARQVVLARDTSEVIDWHHLLLPTEARDAFAKSIAKEGNDWAARVWAAEREASARGLSVDGMLEQIALALVKDGSTEKAVNLESKDQRRSVLRAIIRHAEPSDASEVYGLYVDALSASMFLELLGRESPVRVAAIKEAMKKLDLTSDKRHALSRWLV